MSPTTIYDPEVITTTPANSRADRLAQRPTLRKPSSFRPSKSFKSPRLLAALLVVPSALFIIGLMSVAAEIALGLIGLGNDEYIKADPVLGITHLENKVVAFRHEGFSSARISSAGLRDVEHQLAKPPGVKRIAFIGDSKTQALQVNIEDTFVRLVQDNLNKGESKEKFETINFGMSSYGLVQYYVNFLARVRPYSPDVTVVVYHIFDSGENLPKMGMKSMPAPTVALNKNDELSIDFSYLDAWLNEEGGLYLVTSEWWRRNCHLFQALLADDFMLRNSSKWYKTLFNNVVAPVAPLFQDKEGEGAMQQSAFARFGDWQSVRKSVCDETSMLDKQVSHDDIWTWSVKGNSEYKVLHDAAKSEVNLAGRIFRMFNQACRSAGSKLVIVTLPTVDNMVFYFREIEALKKLGKQEGFTVIDANAQFPSLAPMQRSPLYYRAHFSPSGHRKLAGVITEGLKPLLK